MQMKVICIKTDRKYYVVKGETYDVSSMAIPNIEQSSELYYMRDHKAYYVPTNLFITVEEYRDRQIDNILK